MTPRNRRGVTFRIVRVASIYKRACDASFAIRVYVYIPHMILCYACLIINGSVAAAVATATTTNFMLFTRRARRCGSSAKSLATANRTLVICAGHARARTDVYYTSSATYTLRTITCDIRLRVAR